MRTIAHQMSYTYVRIYRYLARARCPEVEIDDEVIINYHHIIVTRWIRQDDLSIILQYIMHAVLYTIWHTHTRAYALKDATNPDDKKLLL